MKELEQNFLKQETSNNKEKNDLSEKLNSLQKKYDELIINYNTEKNSNLTQINLLTKEKDSFKNNKRKSAIIPQKKNKDIEKLNKRRRRAKIQRKKEKRN